MPVTRYVSVDGQVAHENRAGTVRTYRYDGWGSTSQMVNTNGDVTDSFEFDYFGNQIARTGTTGTPFRWLVAKYQSNGNVRFFFGSLYDATAATRVNSDSERQHRRARSALDTGPGGSDNWRFIVGRAPTFWECFQMRMRTSPWTRDRMIEACKYCKKMYSSPAYKGAGLPKQCDDFVRSDPPAMRRQPYTPQKFGGLPKHENQTPNVVNRSDCIVRVCWREPDTSIHCYDVMPGEMTLPGVDVDIVCYCGKAYKISDFNRIIVENNLMSPEPGELAKYFQDEWACMPIYTRSAAKKMDPWWFSGYDDYCEEAKKFLSGNCCTRPNIQYYITE